MRTLPLADQAKILRKRNSSDRLVSMIGALLVRYVLLQNNWSAENWHSLAFQTGDLGKPYVENSKFKFNHSDEKHIVAVAIDFQGVSEIGIDLANPEDVGDPREFLVHFRPIFSDLELEQIDATISALPPGSQQQYLSLYWALKESYAKFKGVGLHGNLQKYEFLNVSPPTPVPQQISVADERAVYKLLPHDTICSVVSSRTGVPDFVKVDGADMIDYANLFGYGLRRMSTIKVGDQLPPATLYEKGPDDKVDILKELKGKQALIVGVPGAFSGPCSEVHIPGYLNKLPDFISKGYRNLVVISVNDPFVVSAWRNSFGLKPESPNVSFFADSKAEFVKALGLDFDATEIFGNVRGCRICGASKHPG
ncbi:uncharacterized protein OGAPODRAFT_9118 [Ogataea polymorpha]|uniref:uncharacterized protein n=1 Tax=Ogataea polymorpha TaxID=460523 RepID=UPI0007F393CB|nr:uncharacterized protein OGAPODRAFT_9118 [Ogataea polymorpha]OBA14861.1 hypothetical protein OGAPODRAFT_9118 [Ogataea polymorpha]